jgi:hypothetical protein
MPGTAFNILHMMGLEFFTGGMTQQVSLMKISRAMLKFGTLILLLFRNIVSQFAAKVLGLREDAIRNTAA